MTQIEMGKVYRTRDGREVRIYAVDAGACWPVHGAIKDSERPVWTMADWTPEGLARNCLGGPCAADLIEVKPTITRTFHLLHLSNGVTVMANAPDVARHNFANIIAITGPHEITFHEGEGL